MEFQGSWMPTVPTPSPPPLFQGLYPLINIPKKHQPVPRRVGVCWARGVAAVLSFFGKGTRDSRKSLKPHQLEGVS